MKPLAVIREFKRKNVTVRIVAEEECDLDLSFDDTGEIRRQLESGELTAFCVHAMVLVRGNEMASDYLGGCIYKTFSDFQDHFNVRRQSAKIQASENRKAKREKREPRKICIGSYFSDMVCNVCDEARKELADLKTIRVRGK